MDELSRIRNRIGCFVGNSLFSFFFIKTLREMSKRRFEPLLWLRKLDVDPTYVDVGWNK